MFCDWLDTHLNGGIPDYYPERPYDLNNEKGHNYIPDWGHVSDKEVTQNSDTDSDDDKIEP